MIVVPGTDLQRELSEAKRDLDHERRLHNVTKTEVEILRLERDNLQAEVDRLLLQEDADMGRKSKAEVSGTPESADVVVRMIRRVEVDTKVGRLEVASMNDDGEDVLQLATTKCDFEYATIPLSLLEARGLHALLGRYLAAVDGQQETGVRDD